MKRYVTCFVEKAWFEPRALGTKAERYDHGATRPVGLFLFLAFCISFLQSIQDGFLVVWPDLGCRSIEH
jgi:hypothetical protein